ncbi:hypothetical protein SO694_00130031 [Aureococcus anophagefferens]|uniref:Uncharacterized protein n=1 Tax=Aureococcus anophagefferens TaxID=44056 RepID=A0ABR1GFD6_AURAN
MWRRPALFRCPCEDTDVEVKLREYRLQPRTVKGEDDEGNSISSTMAVKELTEVMVTGNNHAWKFYAGASGKGKDNDYFFHHAALTHLVDFYVAKRVKDNKPPLTRIDAKTSKSRRSTLSLDKYFYRFITWTQGDPIGVDDDDVFFADKSAKWSASPVEGCKSDREYRSGSSHAVDDLRRAQPCSCSKCRVKDYDNCRYKAWTAAPEMRQSDGWTRTTIILKPPSGDDRSSARVIAQGLAEKGFKGEFCLTVRWFDLKPCGYYEDYGSQDEQLLEMVIAVGDGRRALVLEPAPRKGRARGAPAQFQLAKASEAAIHNENLDKYVDRAAAGSSA